MDFARFTVPKNIVNLRDKAPLIAVGPVADACKILFRQINGSYMLSVDTPIIYIYGPRGSGKTTLAQIIEAVAGVPEESLVVKISYREPTIDTRSATGPYMPIMERLKMDEKPSSIEDALKRIQAQLSTLDQEYKRIIVILDDLEEIPDPYDFCYKTSIAFSNIFDQGVSVMLIYISRESVAKRSIDLMPDFIKTPLAEGPIIVKRRRMLEVRLDYYPFLSISYLKYEGHDPRENWIIDSLTKVKILTDVQSGRIKSPEELENAIENETFLPEEVKEWFADETVFSEFVESMTINARTIDLSTLLYNDVVARGEKIKLENFKPYITPSDMLRLDMSTKGLSIVQRTVSLKEIFPKVCLGFSKLMAAHAAYLNKSFIPPRENFRIHFEVEEGKKRSIIARACMQIGASPIILDYVHYEMSGSQIRKRIKSLFRASLSGKYIVIILSDAMSGLMLVEALKAVAEEESVNFYYIEVESGSMIPEPHKSLGLLWSLYDKPLDFIISCYKDPLFRDDIVDTVVNIKLFKLPKLEGPYNLHDFIQSL